MFIGKNRRGELKTKGINWHAIPFPSDYHYNSSSPGTAPWEDITRTNRSTYISFLGNARKFSQISTDIREALIVQCNNSVHGPSSCKFGTYLMDKVQARSGNEMHRDSVFCLQPPGDMPTRKSLFDSILSGCIPVLFHPLTGKFMYEMHWSMQDWDSAAVQFDTVKQQKDIIAQRLDVIKWLIDLKAKNASYIVWKQEHVRRLAFRLQYSLIQQDKKNVTRLSIKPMSGRLKYNDAYDIAMKRVMSIHYGTGFHNRTTDYQSCMEVKSYQTSDWCNSTHSVSDPFFPPAMCSFGQCSHSWYAV